MAKISKSLAAFGAGIAGTTFYYRVLCDRLMLDVAVGGLKRYVKDAAGGKIPASDLVLDVGSGDRPHIRADVLCDLYDADDSWERSIELLRDRPFVVGDASALPFKEKVIDTVICQHLMEHMAEPEVVLDELQRVGRTGLIRTPSPLAEKMFSRDVHRWLVSNQTMNHDSLLIMKQKDEAILNDEINHSLGASSTFWHFFGKNISLMETTYRWRDQINVRVDRLQNPQWDGEPDQAYHAERRRAHKVSKFSRYKLRQLATQWFGRTYRHVVLNRPKQIDWESILACPTCKHDVVVGETVVCQNCQCEYPMRGDVPIMTAAAARSLVEPVESLFKNVTVEAELGQ